MASEIPRKTPSEKSFIFIFTLGQFLGVLPLEFFNGVRFTWKSFKTAYCLFNTTLESFIVILSIYHGYINGWNFRNIVRATFYTSNLWGTIGLFRLTKELPPLIRKWYEFDNSMDINYGYPKNLYKRTKLTTVVALAYASLRTAFYTTSLWRSITAFRLTKELPALIKKWYEFDSSMDVHYGHPKYLSRRAKLTSVVALSYACSRTIFYTSSLSYTIASIQLTKELPALIKKWNKFDSSMNVHYGYPNYLRRTKLTSVLVLSYASCQISVFLIYNLLRTDDLAKKRNISYDAALYFKSSFPQVFEFLPYSVLIGILAQFNYIFTYLRMVYIELFCSLLSSFLSLRFQQITERLNVALDKKRSLEFWREVREDYDKICNLCKSVDEKISNIIFIAFSGNLILMLAYLRNCTMVEDLNLQKAYNISAFIILLIRGILMVLYIAWVNDESKEPAFVLNSVSSPQYNTEIQRFLLQISFDSVAFTGNRMFKVTRTLILDIGGVILTYELVLVQFADLNLFG